MSRAPRIAVADDEPDVRDFFLAHAIRMVGGHRSPKYR